MVNEQQRNFYFICLLVIMNQAPDLLLSFSSKYEAVPYLQRWFIDLAAFILILRVSGWNKPRPKYALLILSVQAVSLLNHAIMVTMNLLIQHWPYEIFAIVHDDYKPYLRKAFYLKVVVLFWGSHGLLDRHTGINTLHHSYGASDGVFRLLRNPVS